MRSASARVAVAAVAALLAAGLTGAGMADDEPVVEHVQADFSQDDVHYDESLEMNVLAGTSTTAVVQGSVLRNGSPVVGAELQAFENVSEDSEGSETVLLGVAYTRPDGSYRMMVPTQVTEPSVGASDTGSYRNIELVVMDGDYLDVRHFTVFSGPASSGPMFTTSSYDSQMQDSTEVSGPATINFLLTAGEVVGYDAGMSPAETRRKVVATSYPWVVVGTFFSTYSNSKASFTTSSGATSELGLAYSVTGTKGSFKQTSTTTRTADTVTDWDSENGKRNRGYQQQWRYDKVRIQYCSVKEGYCYKTVYQWEPKGATAGDKYYSPGTPSATKCTSRTGTAAWSASSQKAVNWSNGVDLASVVGINLSSRTGYTASTKITLKSGMGKHRACGTKAIPQAGVHFGQLVVKPPA